MLKSIFLILFSVATSIYPAVSQDNFSTNPDSVVFQTTDITNFWKVFDKTEPAFDAKLFQEEYIDQGSKGLKGFIRFRIENGKHLSKIIRNNLSYYKAIRESSLSIDKKKDVFYESFRKLKQIYPAAVFPDVYFVIGAKNSGGTIFDEGLIIGSEMFGHPTAEFKPILDIDYVDEVVAHELIHFQQHHATVTSLLDQCIVEGSADFIGELISGGHSNQEVYAYGDAHISDLWEEFMKQKNSTDWTNWLYHTKDRSRPKDLGYWIGYRITKAYYDKMENKRQAINDILNISDFHAFFEKSGYNGE
jgi:hypothetical protein